MHVHVHALVPGGGPSLDGTAWVRCHDKRNPRRRQPFLVDNQLLAAEFRKQFLAGLQRLHQRGEIAFTPPALPGEEPLSFLEWAERLAAKWNVYIQPPPKESANAEHVLKYLARYMSGGPIADGRLIRDEDGKVTFWARGKNKADGNRRRPFTLPGREFVRRWAMHILPPRFVRSRSYGGFHNTRRKEYLSLCRNLLGAADKEEPPSEERVQEAEESNEEPKKACPHCQSQMVCTLSAGRPNWGDLFNNYVTCPLWYQPWVHRLRDHRKTSRAAEPRGP